jgi:hypothetical protein
MITLNIDDEFSTSNITKQEFEDLVADLIRCELGVEAVSIAYTKTGVEVETVTGPVEIEIDWEEIVLND